MIIPYDKILMPFLVKGVQTVFTHRQQLGAWLSLSTVHRNHDLRVSFSELLAVPVKGRYLLIRNVRRPEQFGPIGGVVRYFPTALHTILGEIKWQDEMNGSADEPKDLRGYIRGAEFGKLLKWYNAGKQREKNTLALAREIEEELEEIGLEGLLSDQPRIQFEHVRDVHVGPTEVPGKNYLQYRYFGVYQLEVDNERCNQLIADLVKASETNQNLCLATKGEILAQRAKSRPEQCIGGHCGYLFDSKTTGPEPAPFGLSK